MKALIIEDDHRSAIHTRNGLQQMGYESDIATTANAAMTLLEKQTYDLAIVDVGLPDYSGLEVIRSLRASGSELPIIILSASGTPADKVSGLRIGADDYLQKDATMDELQARVDAVRRRYTRGYNGLITVGDITIDPRVHSVTRNGRAIRLSAELYQILEYLVQNQGRVISERQILDKVWGFGFTPSSNVVGAQIYRLKDKLNADGEADRISCVRGLGYVFS